LIGSLNATLIGGESNQATFGGGAGGAGGYAPRGFPQSQNSVSGQFGGVRNGQYQNSGPNPMMVAYTVGPEFVRHVLEGFLSPSHSVEFAVLGVMCTDAVGGGALIQSVTPGSPAEKSGLHSGDVLLNINSNPIQDQIAFARVMLQQKAGKKIAMVVQRGGTKLFIEIVPAKTAD
jgi:S1-C subfamily serine protease